MSGLNAWGMLVGGGGNTSSLSNTFAAWGIEKPVFHFRNMDDDEFTFEIKQNALLNTYLIFGETVSVTKFVNGTAIPWFQGIVSKVTVVGTPETETVRYVCSGPWYQFKRTMWQEAQQSYTPQCQLLPIKTTKVVLYQDPTSGNPITTGQQIQNIVTFAEAAGIPIGIGITPSFINVPFEETRDLTLSDAIRRCMQWTPDGVGWFDYSAGVPVFNANQRAFLTPVSLDLSAKNLIVDLSLVARSDLVPTGVRFNYIGVAQCNVVVPTGCADPTTGIVNTGAPKLSNAPVQVSTITQDVAGIPDLAGGLIGTIDLQQLTATSTEVAPVGLAGQYFLSLLTPNYDGTLRIMEQECTGMLRPGNVLNLLNGPGPWATMNALVQQVTEDLTHGVTEITLGTPQHLAPQNFAWLVNMTARRGLVVSGLAATATPNLGGSANCAQGTNPETQKINNKLNGSPAQGNNSLGNPGGIPGGYQATPLGVCDGNGGSASLNVLAQPAKT